MPSTLVSTFRALGLVAFALGAHAADMTPGLWEYTMTTGINDAPLPLPSLTTRICLSAADAPFGVLTTGPARKGDCRYLNLRQEGRLTRYDMRCGADDRTTGAFEFEANADTVRGQGLVLTGSTRIRQAWTGHRLGTC